jgi:hypothetical protein
MMAVGAKYKCIVGEVVSKHKAEVVDLIQEMMTAITKVSFLDQVAPALTSLRCKMP